MNYYGVTRSTDHLAHYGVKGMKWGVRRAIARGDQKAVDRHFRKAAKKLAKLQDIGLHSGKYAAKAAGYGAAAAGTGGLALGGTALVGKMLNNINPKLIPQAMRNAASVKYMKNQKNLLDNYPKHLKRYREIRSGDVKAVRLGDSVTQFGNKKIDTGIPTKYAYQYHGTQAYGTKAPKETLKVSGNTLYKAGAGLVTAGLAAKAAQNAYRAVNDAKYREKAAQFKKEMDNAFKGTKYEGLYVAPSRRKRKRR